MVLRNVTVLFDEDANEIIFEDELWFHHEECEKLVKPMSAEFWAFFGASIICIMFAGIMSGLTVGLMSFEEKNLSIVMQQSKNMKQRQYAMRVFSLIRNHHLLLVTLLLWNAAAFESLPIFLDKLVPSYVAIILSVTFILIFGEVLPQAICTGPKRLYIGAQSYYLVKGLQLVIYPLAWPLAKFLDWLLGTKGDSAETTFLYVPEHVLRIGGLPTTNSNRMALVEVHGMSDELPDEPEEARKKPKFFAETEEGMKLVDNTSIDSDEEEVIVSST